MVRHPRFSSDSPVCIVQFSESVGCTVAAHLHLPIHSVLHLLFRNKAYRVCLWSSTLTNEASLGHFGGWGGLENEQVNTWLQAWWLWPWLYYFSRYFKIQHYIIIQVAYSFLVSLAYSAAVGSAFFSGSAKNLPGTNFSVGSVCNTQFAMLTVFLFSVNFCTAILD